MQIFSLVFGTVFLALAFWFSRKSEHYFSPILIIISACFFFCGLFSISGLLKSISLEQVACWVVALAFLVGAFRFLQREKISLAFIVFIVAAVFFFCSLSGVQSLLKTGMLSTVTSTLIKYGEKLDDFQMVVVKMNGDLIEQQAQNAKQQKEIENQQDLIRNALVTVEQQQAKISKQSETIASLQKVLDIAQSNLTKINADVVRQQFRIDNHQKELEDQQSRIRHAQTDVATEQIRLTSQLDQMVQMQTELTVAQTNIGAQRRKIDSVQSLINNLYSRTYTETFTASDTEHVVIRPSGNATQVFFKLSSVPVENSIQGMEQFHVRPGLFGLLDAYVFQGGTQVGVQTPLTGIMSTNNIAFIYYYGSHAAIPKNALFFLKYTRDEHATNIIKKIELKDNKVFLDGKRYIWPLNSEAP